MRSRRGMFRFRPFRSSNHDLARTPPMGPLILQATGAIVTAMAGAVGLYLILAWLLGITPHPKSATLDQQKLLADLVKIALGLAAGVGAAVALVIGFRRARVEEASSHRDDRRLFSSRYQDAADLIGHDKAAVRLAGIYAMSRLADDWVEQQQQCIDVLCAYLRLPYDPANKEPGEQEVRFTVIRLIAAHLQPSIGRSWRGRTFDFSGAVFDGGNFRSAVFSGGHVDFSAAEFVGEQVNFSGVRFTGGTVEFVDAVFSGYGANFSEAVFSRGTVNFSGAKCSGGALRFIDAEFSGARVLFFGTEFSGADLDFRRARIVDGSLDFSGAKFTAGIMNFSHVEFAGGFTGFNRAKFAGGTTIFHRAAFSLGVTDYRNAQFCGADIRFNFAEFCGATADFSDAAFSDGTIQFDNAKFSDGSVGFIEADFSGGAVDFIGAEFSGALVNFRGAKFRGSAVDLSRATLHAVKPPHRPDPPSDGRPPRGLPQAPTEGLKLPAWAKLATS